MFSLQSSGPQMTQLSCILFLEHLLWVCIQPRGKQIFCKYQVVNRWAFEEQTFSITTSPSQSRKAAMNDMWISVCCCVRTKLYVWIVQLTSNFHVSKMAFPPNLFQFIRSFLWKSPTSKIIIKTTWFSSFILLIPAITLHLTVHMQKN